MSQEPLNETGGTAARVAARLPENLRVKVEAAARRRGVPVSVIIRECIQRYFETASAELDRIAVEGSHAPP